MKNTGWPPGLMQDDSRIDARRCVRVRVMEIDVSINPDEPGTLDIAIQNEQDRFSQCSGCGHIVTWFQHSQLRAAVDCPRCHAKDQFGPGVYVADYAGKTFDEVVEYKAAIGRQRTEQ